MQAGTYTHIFSLHTLTPDAAWPCLALPCPTPPQPPRRYIVDGKYRMETRGVDLAGNIGPTHVYEWWVDTSAPGRPTIFSGPAALSTSTVATFQVYLLDAQGGCERDDPWCHAMAAPCHAAPCYAVPCHAMSCM